MMRANSLALRLFLSATVWTAAILLITGIVLSSLYRQAVERAFDRRLGVYLKTLVADVSSPEDANDKFPQLGEPLFELPLSGWYWQVTRFDTPKPDVRSSRSLWDGGLPNLESLGVPVTLGGSRQGYVEGPDDQRLRLIERTIDLGEDGKFLIAVAGDATEVEDEIWGFDRALVITFVVLAIVLLFTTLFQVRFGLLPLKRISERLIAIRSGSAERLDGTFPEEIAPLARELNALIEANREIVERARTHVGNLAHALKTPLSVLVNEAATRQEDPLALKIREQADIMRDQVTRHLERARLAARLTSLGSITEIKPVVAALVRSMEKIYHDRGIEIAFEASEDAKFRGERQDIEEMIGNLIDNACKWARARVLVDVADVDLDGIALVRICVDDDGPGLSPSERQQIARRGNRLDETKPGSGLGLSIVVELATLYGGQLNFDAAPSGGLRAELMLPSVPAI